MKDLFKNLLYVLSSLSYFEFSLANEIERDWYGQKNIYNFSYFSTPNLFPEKRFYYWDNPTSIPHIGKLTLLEGLVERNHRKEKGYILFIRGNGGKLYAAFDPATPDRTKKIHNFIKLFGVPRSHTLKPHIIEGQGVLYSLNPEYVNFKGRPYQVATVTALYNFD